MSQKKKVLLSAVIVIALVLVSYFVGIRSYLSLSSPRDLNIVLLTLDAARFDHFAFGGHPGRLTPTIDRLAQEGVLFEQAYCYAGSTPPSMAAIFTGKYPYWPMKVRGGGGRWNHKQSYGLGRFFPEELEPGFPSSLETLPELLKRNGYKTVGISTNPYLTKDFNFDRGFDFFEEFSPKFEVPYASAEDVGRKTRAYISELKDDKFFIWAHFMDIHAPLLGYNPYRDEAKRRGFQPEQAHQPVSEWTQVARDFMKKFGSKAVPDWKPTEENFLKALQEYRLGYAAQLVRVDIQIEKILAVLKRNNLREDTLVIITNDHGDELMEHGDFAHTGQLYEEIIRGVWIMHNRTLWPEPIRIKHRVGLADMVPTLIKVLELQGEGNKFDGMARASLIRHRNDNENAFVFGVLDQRAYAIDGKYKLIVNNDFGKKDHGAARTPPAVPQELYNLKDDPREQENLAPRLPEVTDRLLIKLKRVFLEKGIRFWTEDAPSQEITEKTKERLKALGYIQ